VDRVGGPAVVVAAVVAAVVDVAERRELMEGLGVILLRLPDLSDDREKEGRWNPPLVGEVGEVGD